MSAWFCSCSLLISISVTSQITVALLPQAAPAPPTPSGVAIGQSRGHLRPPTSLHVSPPSASEMTIDQELRSIVFHIKWFFLKQLLSWQCCIAKGILFDLHYVFWSILLINHSVGNVHRACGSVALCVWPCRLNSLSGSGCHPWSRCI